MGRNPNGEGSYRKRSDGLYEWKQKKNGKVRYLTAGTQAELQEKIKEVKGLPIRKGKTTVEAWFDMWLKNYVEPLKKPATAEQYTVLYNTHIKPVIGEQTLQSVSKFDIQSIIATANKKGRSTWTMKHIRKILHIAFKRACTDKLINENPVEDIEIPKKQAKERKTLTAEEFDNLLGALKTCRWIWATRFIVVTGLRLGEMASLKWADIDFDNLRIKVAKSTRGAVTSDTKSAKIHHAPLSQRAINALKGQREMLKAEHNSILYNEDLKATDIVFPSEDGTMIRPKSYYTAIIRHAKKISLKVTPHMLRHTFVYITRGKLDLKDLQEALGHDRSTTTLDLYGDMISDNARTVSISVDDAFDNADARLAEKRKERKQRERKIVEFKKR